MNKPYDLSSINALVCFESAARNLSFKNAAQEMNVTPAAISHRIKALELDLGCQLFLRSNRGVELTEKGAFLLFSLQRGFETISDTVTLLRDQPEKVDVTIRTTTAVSSLWLTPKISLFWKTHPNITISQIVSDVPKINAKCDLNVSYSHPIDEGGDSRKLFQGNIIAIGTQSFADEYNVKSVNDLLKAPLIHVQDDETGWTTWTDWFQELEHPSPKSRSFFLNNYMIGLQAAQDNAGAILGWDRLVGKLLDEEQLIQLVPDSIPSPMGFYLNIHPRASEKAKIFADWLGENMLST